MPPFDKHIFICCNRREPGHVRAAAAIPPVGSPAESVQEGARRARHQRRIRANKSGCLDQCEKGPTVVVYPDNVWYGRVTEADVNEIVEQHIIGGRPVERLLMPE